MRRSDFQLSSGLRFGHKLTHGQDINHPNLSSVRGGRGQILISLMDVILFVVHLPFTLIVGFIR